MSNLEVVVGGQFGSEGKGHVTSQLVRRTNGPVLNIRVAGPNAGHCVVDSQNVKYPLRSVPVGAAVADNVSLYIAAGSEVELKVLLSEIELLRSKGHSVSDINVSGEATILTEEHHKNEADLKMQASIGSTGKGIGAARADRVMRTAKRIKDDEGAREILEKAGVSVIDDDQAFLEGWLQRKDATIIIEGTQGYGLGQHAGFYPKCTSSDTRAIDFLAMSGISPWHKGVEKFDIWVCARVYPIRVAGNSGPLLGETSWENLGLEAEYTTVTHKVRRVGQWDPQLLNSAVKANGGPSEQVHVALTMVDQKFPQVSGFQGPLKKLLLHAPALERFIIEVEESTGSKVGVVTTSDKDASWV